MMKHIDWERINQPRNDIIMKCPLIKPLRYLIFKYSEYKDVKQVENKKWLAIQVINNHALYQNNPPPDGKEIEPSEEDIEWILTPNHGIRGLATLAGISHAMESWMSSPCIYLKAQYSLFLTWKCYNNKYFNYFICNNKEHILYYIYQITSVTDFLKNFQKAVINQDCYYIDNELNVFSKFSSFYTFTLSEKEKFDMIEKKWNEKNKMLL
jgi:hypothetical protein